MRCDPFIDLFFMDTDGLYNYLVDPNQNEEGVACRTSIRIGSELIVLLLYSLVLPVHHYSDHTSRIESFLHHFPITII